MPGSRIFTIQASQQGALDDCNPHHGCLAPRANRPGCGQPCRRRVRMRRWQRHLRHPNPNPAIYTPECHSPSTACTLAIACTRFTLRHSSPRFRDLQPHGVWRLWLRALCRWANRTHLVSVESARPGVPLAWTGDTALLAAANDWRSSFVMPARDVALAASQRD